jgi:hypothetical protein
MTAANLINLHGNPPSVSWRSTTGRGLSESDAPPVSIVTAADIMSVVRRGADIPGDKDGFVPITPCAAEISVHRLAALDGVLIRVNPQCEGLTAPSLGVMRG